MSVSLMACSTPQQEIVLEPTNKVSDMVFNPFLESAFESTYRQEK